jgi:circadian clock protein KaiC
MVNSVKQIPTGFNFIDNNWGGVYVGGSYLVVGSKTSAKSLFVLKFLKDSIDKGDCVYFSNLRSKDLFIQASIINFDLQSKLEEGSATLIRVLSVPQNIPNESIDDYLIEYLHDIIDLIKKYQPKFLIFDELTEFVRYQNVELLRQKFLDMLEALEEFDVTSFFITTQDDKIETNESLDKIKNCFTGVIKFDDSSGKYRSDATSGIVTITPNVGHVQGQFSAEYILDDGNGLSTKSSTDEIVKGKDSPSSKRIKIYKPGTAKKIKEEAFEIIEKKSDRNKQIELDEFSFSNIYEYTDFLLILNTHIAIYKATGQNYHLLCFNLKPSTNEESKISLEHFRNTIISAADNKDKICFIGSKVFVLIVRSKNEMVNNLTERVHILLTDSKRNYQSQLLEQISINIVEPENSFENSEIMIESILKNEEELNNFTPLINYLS